MARTKACGWIYARRPATRPHRSRCRSRSMPRARLRCRWRMTIDWARRRWSCCWPKTGVCWASYPRLLAEKGERMSAELDALDRLAARAFDGYIVRKDLALRFKGQYPVPTYVGEFLLGRYCASTNEAE